MDKINQNTVQAFKAVRLFKRSLCSTSNEGKSFQNKAEPDRSLEVTADNVKKPRFTGIEKHK